MRILIIEDNTMDQELIRQWLYKTKHELLMFSGFCGNEASVLSFAPDMVILDWRLPTENPLDICMAIKLMFPKAYVMVYTALIYLEKIHDAVEAGIDDFLTKAWRPEEFLLRVKLAERLTAKEGAK